MHFTYLLYSRSDKKFDTGYTNNLQKRLREHNKGKVFSTKLRIPMDLVYYEACHDEQDARVREKYLKSGMGKKYLRNRIQGYLKNL